MSKRFVWMVVLSFSFSAAIATGCGSSGGSSTTSTSGQDMDELAALLDKPEPTAPSTGAQQDASIDESSVEAPSAPSESAENLPSEATPQSATAPQASRTVAGRAPIGEGGYLVAIGGARRHILNRVEDLAWTQAVQHFQATEGRLPRDHEEFMTRIVEEHGIDLGYKEEDQEFLYDPNEGQWGTVYVVAKEPAPAR